MGWSLSSNIARCHTVELGLQELQLLCYRHCTGPLCVVPAFSRLHQGHLQSLSEGNMSRSEIVEHAEAQLVKMPRLRTCRIGSTKINPMLFLGRYS